MMRSGRKENFAARVCPLVLLYMPFMHVMRSNLAPTDVMEER